MKTQILTIVSCLFLTSCALPPSNPDYWLESRKNSCFPAAVTFKESLKKYDVWSEIILYRKYDLKEKKFLNHAAVVFEYPTNSNRIWTYDNFGTYQISADTTNPFDVAQKAEDARYFNKIVTYAEFLK
jgi:hypothetical protein